MVIDAPIMVIEDVYNYYLIYPLYSLAPPKYNNRHLLSHPLYKTPEILLYYYIRQIYFYKYMYK